ncbi:helix-turn-helix domain-containing protein [Streptomyces sp. NPDC006925]|uniref:helix-turn-helix domain-containing protein n=1 Tax=Streptomyces sp. NPDC006925 TaxID=3364768 RepID=UPI0036BF48B2
MHEGFETSIGDRLGRLRTRRGLTQERLAESAGVCVDIIRKLEQNRRRTARMATLNQLARALDVDVSVLVGTPVTFEARPDGSAPSVLALRRAVSPVADLLGDGAEPDLEDPEEPPTAGALRASLRATEGTRRAGRMGEVGTVLPQLIRDARAAVRAYEGSDRDRTAAYAVLAEAYQVAATTLTALGNPDAAFTAMERAADAARRAGDPHLEAIGAATLAWVLTKQGRLEDAEHVAHTEAARIEPTFRSQPLDLSLWGILLLRAATAAVRQGERHYDRVDELLRMATAAAAGIGSDRLDYATPFGPTNTAVAKVNFQVEMDRCADALGTARTVPDLASLPPTWRARFHVDRALAHAGLDRDEAATRALLTAEQDAPEWMRYHGTARRLVADLHSRERRRTSPLAELADRLHLDE